MDLNFNFARMPRLIFGAGRINEAAGLLSSWGRVALLITGGGSHKASGRWDSFLESLETAGVTWHHAAVCGEPSPDMVDAIAAEYRDADINAVLAWGGGGAVDAGKAVSAMLRHKSPVADYLEGVGDPSRLTGDKVPFVAVPTTSGTGAEATKNAVLSRVGPDGYKESLRHDNFVPDAALLDPELMTSCPPHVTAACGMDALTQLLESYASGNGSPITESLAFSGLQAAKENLVPACTTGAGDPAVRAGMAYAALMSGVTLANAGLGAVHGLAGPLGGFFPVPHGAACGTLLAPITRITIEKLLESDPQHPGLKKYACAGSLLSGDFGADLSAACHLLVHTLEHWSHDLNMPRLSEFGVTENDLEKIADAGGNKYNPAPLSRDEMIRALRERL